MKKRIISIAIGLLFSNPIFIKTEASEATNAELMNAIEQHNTNKIKELLAPCASIKFAPPLFKAISLGSGEMVKILLDHGANIEATSDNGVTPLLKAASVGNSDVLKILLDQGANLKAKDRFGQTVLATAVHFNHSNIVNDLLAAKNFDVDYEINNAVQSVQNFTNFGSRVIDALLKTDTSKETVMKVLDKTLPQKGGDYIAIKTKIENFTKKK